MKYPGKAFLPIMLAGLVLNGCVSSYQVYIDEAPSLTSDPTQFLETSVGLRKDASYRQETNYFFWTLAGHPEISIRNACKGKKMSAAIVNKADFSNALIAIGTLGIWVPRTVEVWCES